MMAKSRRTWISEAERDAVAARLCEEFSRNRLTKAELETRLDDTFAAETRDALHQVTEDLAPAEPAASAPSASGRTGVAHRVRERRGTRALVYAVFLWAAGGILFGAGWLGSGMARWLIVVGLAAIVLGGRPPGFHPRRQRGAQGRRRGAYGGAYGGARTRRR